MQKKEHTLILIFFFFYTLLNAQRHSIALFYSPQITKTNYDSRTQDPFGSGNFFDFDKPSMGYKMGIEYGYKPTPKSRLTLGFFDNHGGQKSEFFYKTPADSASHAHGGGFDEHLFWSTSVSIDFQRVFYKKKNFQLSYFGGTGLDLLRKSVIVRGTFGRVRGELGSSILSYAGQFGFNDKYFTAIEKGLKWQLFRYELSLGVNSEIKVLKNIMVRIIPRFSYLTKMTNSTKNKNKNAINTSGDIFSFALMTGIGFNF